MASATMMPNPNMNPGSFSSDSLPKPCSKKVALKRKSDISLSRRYAAAPVIIALTESVALAATNVEVAETRPALARVRREVLGSNNWEDLLVPLDPLLRHEIIRYGEFATACYEAFDLDPASKRYLNCKFGKRNILREVGLGYSGYQVTKYIYATPDINMPIQNCTCPSLWIGYVVVSTDEELDPHHPRPDVKVEAEFLALYTSNDSATSTFGLGSYREQLLYEVSALLNRYRGEEMSITLAGHSMGSSLALLLAYGIAELGLTRGYANQDIPVTVFSFAGPRVGNPGFKERCEELGVKVLRIVNVNDPITKLHALLFNENFRLLHGRYEFPWRKSCYAHVGVELALDFFKMQNPSCVHDLETYLRLLRCPRALQIRREGTNFINRAKELLTSAQNFDALPWKMPRVPL
ncbi:hypothetical protein U1Q18_030512 [Sarracenia purpurea var. burkii]